MPKPPKPQVRPHQRKEWPERLTLDNLKLSPRGELVIKTLSGPQRKSLFDLCSIFHLTFYEEGMRAAAQQLRELIRKNTLDPTHNKCDFDMTDDEKKLAASPLRSRHDPKARKAA